MVYVEARPIASAERAPVSLHQQQQGSALVRVVSDAGPLLCPARIACNAPLDPAEAFFGQRLGWLSRHRFDEERLEPGRDRVAHLEPAEQSAAPYVPNKLEKPADDFGFSVHLEVYDIPNGSPDRFEEFLAPGPGILLG